jgi:hypothetical protein
MAGATSKDVFANMAILTVTESAANTLTFKKLETGIGLMEKVAWVINRVEYLVSSLVAATFNGDGDELRFGLSISNAFSAATLNQEAIIDWNNVFRRDLGAAASGALVYQPFIKDFASLPGGGILVPPVPLYAFAVGTGLVSAETVTCRLAYTLRSMSTDEYWELVEARRIISS